jgi:hypothetical protein
MGGQEFLTLGKFYEAKKVLSTLIYEISEKVQKSLITPIIKRLHRLET